MARTTNRHPVLYLVRVAAPLWPLAISLVMNVSGMGGLADFTERVLVQIQPAELPVGPQPLCLACAYLLHGRALQGLCGAFDVAALHRGGYSMIVPPGIR